MEPATTITPMNGPPGVSISVQQVRQTISLLEETIRLRQSKAKALVGLREAVASVIGKSMPLGFSFLRPVGLALLCYWDVEIDCHRSDLANLEKTLSAHQEALRNLESPIVVPLMVPPGGAAS